jgi:hypothetical protein
MCNHWLWYEQISVNNTGDGYVQYYYWLYDWMSVSFLAYCGNYFMHILDDIKFNSI